MSRKPSAGPDGRRRPARAALIAAVAAIILVPAGWFAFYNHWLGMPFGERQLGWYLSGNTNARRQRGALSEAAARIARGDHRWDPQVIELSRSPVPEVREAAARAMAADPKNAGFLTALAPLLEDISPPSRRAAAVALAASGDPRARPELRAMLHAYTVYSPYSGGLKLRVKNGSSLNAGSLIATVGNREIRSQLEGFINHVYEQDGASLQTGQRIADIAPGDRQTIDALNGLRLAGDQYDIEEIRRFTAPSFSPAVRKQAEIAATQLASKPAAR